MSKQVRVGSWQFNHLRHVWNSTLITVQGLARIAGCILGGLTFLTVEGVITAPSLAQAKWQSPSKLCDGVDFIGRHTVLYNYASISSPGIVNTGNVSEWHIHTQNGCFFWGLGLWSKPEENKKGCVNWVFIAHEEQGKHVIYGMVKDIEGDRFLGYGKFDLAKRNGIMFDRFMDPKLEDVKIEECKGNCDKVLTHCDSIH